MKQQHHHSALSTAWLGRIGAAVGTILLCTLTGPALSATAPPPATSEAAAVMAGKVQPVHAVLGKSTVLQLNDPATRMAVGNPSIADVTLLNPREFYILGKGLGSTNLVIWTRNGSVSVFDILVNIDASALQDKLAQLLPDEKNIKVTTAADSVVLSGSVSDVGAVERAVAIAEAYVRNSNRSLVMPVTAGDAKVESGTRITVGGPQGSGGAALRDAGARVVNLLQVSNPHQVMLEVKVAEVSRTLLDKLGAGFNFNRISGSGNWSYQLFGNFLTDSSGFLEALRKTGQAVAIDAEKTDGLVKILAEPNIMAVSGQTGSFLAGGKIFIPVARADNAVGGTTISLEEKEFGIGLQFTPTVLGAGRINLVVAPEVSELSQTGSPFTTINGQTAILPSFTVRRASTTVQLDDGQSLAIAGLIKNNVTETVRAFPILGELPIIGALFRSSEFQNDKTELVFVITPRLVKTLPPDYALPTDSFTPPSRAGFFLGGKMEGSTEEEGADTQAQPADAPAADAPAANTTQAWPESGGFVDPN